MKKTVFLVLLAILLTGCLGTNKQLLEVNEDGTTSWANTAPVTSHLWWRKNTAGMKKSENPWEKFNQEVSPPSWHNPWAQTDLAALGVTQFKPTKPLRYRIIRTRPKVQILIVPQEKFPEFYRKFFKKKHLRKHRFQKHPKQDKLFPVPKKRSLKEAF